MKASLFSAQAVFQRPRTAAVLALAMALLPAPPLEAQGNPTDRNGGEAQASPIPAVRPVRTGGLQAEVAAIIMSGQQGGRLAVEVLTLAAMAQEDKVRVPVLVEVDGKSLVASHETPGEPLTFEIFIYALSQQGALQDSLIQTYEVDVDRLGDRLRSGFRFEGDLDLRPGNYSLRVLVRNPKNDVAGLRLRDLQVPAPEETLVSAPLFAGASSRWLGLREGRERGQVARPRLPYFEAQGLPASRPVVHSGQTVQFRLLAHRLDSVDSTVSIRAAHQQSGRAIDLVGRIDGYETPDTHGNRWLEVSTDLGTLPAGLYRLDVSLGADEPTLMSPPLPIIVLPRKESDTASHAWADVTPTMLSQRTFRASGPAPVASSKDRRRRARSLKTEGMREGYQAVLDLLATGQLDAARTALFALTTEHYGNGQAGLEALAEVQLEAAARVAEVRPPGLAPLLTLHQWLYQDARGNDLPLVSTHARTVTLDLVELYLRTGMSLQAKRQAAAVLVSLGCEIQRAGMSRLGERLLRRVLTLDLDNDVALLSLGAAAELRGEYEVAIDILDTLVGHHPNHGEGRLRLAINLLRHGRRPRLAVKHLETLINGDHRRWVLSLAYQELVKIRLQRGKFDEAHDMLLAAVERLPGDEKLHLQLAFVHDARLDAPKARATLQAMELRSNRRRSAPRHVYTEWPETSLHELRRSLEEETQTLVAELDRALKESAQATGGRR